MKDKIFIQILLFAFLIKGILVSSIIPLWQGPDEFAHYGYIQTLAEKREFPNLETTNLSKEIAETIDGADTYAVANKQSKVFEGSLNPDYEGFMQYKKDGFISKCYRCNGDSNSLEIIYDFIENISCSIGLSRTIREPGEISEIVLKVKGDNSNIPVEVSLSSGDSEFIIGNFVIDWIGWKRISMKKSDQIDSTGFKNTGQLSLMLGYDPEINRINSLSGKIYIDDMEIYFGDKLKPDLTFDFEDDGLRKSDSGWWNQVSQHPPFYYLWGSILYLLFQDKDIYTIAYIIRFLSVFFGTLTVFFSYLAGRNLYPENRYLYLGIPLFISFSSSFTFYTSVINSDVLLDLLFTMFIYYIAKKSNKPGSFKYTVLIAIIAGSGMLTKMTFIPGIVSLPFTLFCLFSSKRYYFKNNEKHKGLRFGGFSETFKRLVIELLLIITIIVTISGWWYYRNHNLYGSIFTIATNVREDARLLTIMNRKNAAQIITDPEIINWYLFSWLLTRKETLLSLFYFLIYFLSLFGWSYLIFQHTKSTGFKLKSFCNLLSPVLILFLVYISVFSYIVLGSAISSGIIRGIHGRYFHPIILLYSIFIVGGLTNLPKILRSKYILISFYMGFILVGIYDLSMRLIDFYI